MQYRIPSYKCVPVVPVVLMTGCRKKTAVAPTASLSAEPATIEPVQAVTLKWSSTDATEVTISGLGTVAAEGSQQVQPGKPTTYDLVATGPGGSTTASAIVTVVVAHPMSVVMTHAERLSLLARRQQQHT